MDRKETVGKVIVSFERVADGILIPLIDFRNGQKKSYWRDKVKEKNEKANP